MKNRKAGRILYWSLITVLILIIVACAGVIAAKVITDAQNENQYQELQAMKPNSTRPSMNLVATEPTKTAPEDSLPEQTDPPEPTTVPNIDDTVLFEYQALYEMNRDMVGWIQIEGTSIDYPVVQSKEIPNFYLRRNFYKEDAVCGTIYAREACNINQPSDNVTLYGHNMRNGTMFADLHKFEKKSFWKEHRYVNFDTLNEYRTYEIVAVFKVSVGSSGTFNYHSYDTFATEEAFQQFIGKCKSLQLYETGITPVYGDKLLTLSTCDKSLSNGRLAVVCRLVGRSS